MFNIDPRKFVQSIPAYRELIREIQSYPFMNGYTSQTDVYHMLVWDFFYSSWGDSLTQDFLNAMHVDMTDKDELSSAFRVLYAGVFYPEKRHDVIWEILKNQGNILHINYMIRSQNYIKTMELANDYLMGFVRLYEDIWGNFNWSNYASN